MMVMEVPYLRKATESNITILKLPPHTSHLLQPLDVGVFRPAKVVWPKVLDQFFKQSHFSTVGKAQFTMLLKQLHDSVDAFKRQHAVAGFMKSGIFPLDKSAIDWAKVKPAQIVATVHAHQEGVSNEATESGSTHPSIAPTDSQEGISNETSQNNSSTGCPSDVPIGSPASLPIPLELYRQHHRVLIVQLVVPV